MGEGMVVHKLPLPSCWPEVTFTRGEEGPSLASAGQVTARVSL